MRYYLVDESRYPQGKPGSLCGLIFRFESAANSQELLAAIDEMLKCTKHLDSFKRAVAVWITYVVAPHKGIKLEPQDVENLDEVKNMLATRIEQWEVDIRKEGVEEGFDRGVEEGFDKGIDKGETTLFLKLLKSKYGAVPNWAKRRVDEANAQQIEQWAAKIFTADTLAELFED